MVSLPALIMSCTSIPKSMVPFLSLQLIWPLPDIPGSLNTSSCRFQIERLRLTDQVSYLDAEDVVHVVTDNVTHAPL